MCKIAYAADTVAIDKRMYNHDFDDYANPEYINDSSSEEEEKYDY